MASKKLFGKSLDNSLAHAFAAAAASATKTVLSGTDLRGSVKATFENRKEAIHSRISKLEESGVRGTGKASNDTRELYLENINEFVSGNKKFEDVIDDYAKLYAEKIESNAVWSWAEDIVGGNGLNYKQRKEIRLQAMEKGLIPDVPFKEGTRYPDFSKVDGLIEKVEYLPERLWGAKDPKQFEWLDSRIEGGRPKGMTWHHSEIDGRMELVPFGIHNIINHKGGRSPGHWAYIGKR